MAYWAELDENNIVIRVLRGDNDDPNGDEGYQWLLDNLGGTWIQTSYNGSIRYNFAGTGFTYDPIDDAFIPPMPTCGHETIMLNKEKVWRCTDCEDAPIATETM